MSSFNLNYRTLRVSTGHNIRFIDHKPAQGEPKATLLCVHGFPDFSYGWRYQVAPWAKAGFRVIAPDTLGCGGSDKPAETSAYTIKSIVNDLVALLDALSIRQVVIIGHDWGAMVTWRFLQWHPDRCLAVVALSIPYYPPPPQYIPIEEAAKRVPNFGYQVYFASEQSTKEIEANIERFFKVIYRPPGVQGSMALLGEIQPLVLGKADFEAKSVLTNEELNAYITSFRDNMHGPLSYYRNTRRNFDDYSTLPSKLPQDIPILLLYGSEDIASSERAAKASKRFAPQTAIVRMEGRGHWLMVEAKDEVTERVIAFVNNVVGAKGKL
ncbi:alpha/beta-hydrolase [Exidia glandulosa HHB12029]|uniref:Alpha/beta-hydrolase n=1 Tax=Exidia glandulosa HHB12029 TaxID=1314781 RepID=A0A166BVF0_EXIGL|nr:alpha/beta-hydrolase [Exidia glandulosa HHB12029]